MDSDLKKKLVLVGAVFAAALTFYFIVSPYQNCIRDSNRTAAFCTAKTTW